MVVGRGYLNHIGAAQVYSLQASQQANRGDGIETATNRCAGAGSHAGIEKIDIEGNTAGTVADNFVNFLIACCGLCVAFCEAQNWADEDEAITGEELSKLLEKTPSGRILANYNKKKTSSAPDMLDRQ
jgi:hypothetical protein